MSTTYHVCDYHTGSDLDGTPSADLITASLAEHSGTGAVGAVLDRETHVWRLVPADHMTTTPDARVVYVAPAAGAPSTDREELRP